MQPPLCCCFRHTHVLHNLICRLAALPPCAVVFATHTHTCTERVEEWSLQCESYAVDLNLLHNLGITKRSGGAMQDPVDLLDAADTSPAAREAHALAAQLGEKVSGIM